MQEAGLEEVEDYFTKAKYGTTGGGDLHLPPPEHGRTIIFNQARYGNVYGGGATPGDKRVEVVV